MPLHRLLCSLFVLSSLMACQPESAEEAYRYIDLAKFEDGIHHWDLYSEIRSPARLDSADIIGIANHLLAYQNPDGGWPKNIDWLAVIDPDSVIGSLSERYRRSTFDNRNTFPQIEYLAEVYRQTNQTRYRDAAQRGLRFILEREHPQGGWRGWDANVITFNDDVMTGIMALLLDIEQDRDIYRWLEPALRQPLLAAYERGLAVILDCQVVIQGKHTAWCQQHDFDTHAPVQGRAYEHPSVTARESCDIIQLLMRIEEPDSAICATIHAAVSWLREAQITGYRYAKVPIPERPYHATTIDYDRVLVADNTAAPLWARYYDLEHGEPFLSLRDGTIVYGLSEISFDRRVGYDWYGYWPEEVLAAYPAWKAKHPTCP